MKFTAAWAEVIAQNLTLKISILVSGVCCTAFAFVALKLALEEPLVIERSCFSAVATLGSSQRNQSEIEAFVREALYQRFNSDTKPKDGYLSSSELEYRKQEQKELAARQVRQKLVVNKVEVKSATEVLVDADRLVSVGEVRSAFSFPVVVGLESSQRTEGNPYGLLIVRVKQPEKETKK